jgi:chromosome segregation ATPase
MTTQNIKEELNKGMENLTKKNQTEILEIKVSFSQTKNTVESHSIRLEQVEDRISEFKDKMEIKEKPEAILVKELKNCEKNMQELIMGIEEGEEGQAKGIGNIFNKIITENFPNLEKSLLEMNQCGLQYRCAWKQC